MTTADKVRRHLQTCDLRRIRGESMAGLIGCGVSKLNYLLQSENTSYGRLLDAERKCRTLRLFERNPRAGTTAIARVCGYADIRSAQTAARRWFGCTVREFKARAAA